MTRRAQGAPIGTSHSRLEIRSGKSKYETTYKIKKTAWEWIL